MSKLYWEDFVPGLVAEYGPRLVTAEEIKAFAAAYDPQPMHLDEEAARQTMMGGLAASGWHTCAILMRLIADGFLINSSSMGGPGCEEVKWLAPVRPGDRLSVRSRVLATRPSTSKSDRGFVKFLFEVINDADDCVMTVTTDLMFGRREPNRALG